MDYKYFFHNFINIIINPTKIWETADSKIITPKKIRNYFLLPLILIISVSAVAGSLLFTNVEMKVVYSIFEGLKVFGLLYFTIYAATYLLSEITFPLDLGKDFAISFRLIVFTAAPFFMCQILSRLFESLLFINIIGLYGLYIFWIGAEKLLNPPQYKKAPLLVATVISLAVIYVISDMLFSMLADRIYFAFFS